MRSSLLIVALMAATGLSRVHAADDVAAAYEACRQLSSGAPTLTLDRPEVDKGPWLRNGPPTDHTEFASLWLEGRTIRVVVVEAGSSDNTMTVRYCFRSDGTLALIHSTLGTFYSDPGPVRVERRTYFDATGHKLRTRERVYNTAGKLVKQSYGGFWFAMERVFVKSDDMRKFFGRALERFAP